jgi:hypothetical protein
MQITTHRILFLSATEHAFLVEGSKIKEVLISVCDFVNFRKVGYCGVRSFM